MSALPTDDRALPSTPAPLDAEAPPRLHKRLSTTEIYAAVAPALVKEAYDLHGFGPRTEPGRRS